MRTTGAMRLTRPSVVPSVPRRTSALYMIVQVAPITIINPPSTKIEKLTAHPAKQPIADREHEPRHQRKPGAGAHRPFVEPERAQQPVEPEDQKRHAEAERDPVLGADARHRHQRAESDQGDRCYPAAAAAAANGGVGQIADRRDDVHAAHPRGRERQHRKGQEHTHGVGDHEAGGLDGEGEVEVRRRGEHAAEREHHPECHEHAERGADQRRDEVVRGALVHEHLHEVAAAGADRPRDPELAAPLGSQHDEDQKDEQDPGRDRERAEGREEGDERRADAVCRVERVLPGLVGLEPERRDGRLQCLDDTIGRRNAATVGDVHAVDQSRLTQQRLRPVERHQHAVVGRRRARVAHDRLHTRALDSNAGQDPNAVSGLRAERLRALRVQVDLVRSELRKRDGLPSCAHRAEGDEGSRVTRKQRHLRFVLPAREILDRRAPGDDRRHRTHQPRRATRSSDPVGVTPGEVASARACSADRE